MGVIRSNKSSLVTVDDYVLGYWLETSDESSEESEENIKDEAQIQKTPRRRSRNKKIKCDRFPTPKRDDYFSRKNGVGARRQRRRENDLLLGDALNAEICEDLSDMLPDGMSPFTVLFQEREKMKIWNDFIERPEEEQAAVLWGAKRLFEELKKEDLRDVHPGYASDSCFKRLRTKFRDFLSHQRHLPMGKLDYYERELVTFFGMDPNGIWFSTLESSFDRFLVHLVAEYLALSSSSYDTPEKLRGTQVENRYRDFQEPPEHLSNFLQRKFSYS